MKLLFKFLLLFLFCLVGISTEASPKAPSTPNMKNYVIGHPKGIQSLALVGHFGAHSVHLVAPDIISIPLLPTLSKYDINREYAINRVGNYIEKKWIDKDFLKLYNYNRYYIRELYNKPEPYYRAKIIAADSLKL